jgi:hypothetical protein
VGWARFWKKALIEALPILYYPEESIIKANVSFQIPEVFSAEAIQVLFEKKLNWQSNCIVSNPRIFKGEAIQVLLRQKIWIGKAIVSFQTPEFFKVKRYKFLFQTPEFSKLMRYSITVRGSGVYDCRVSLGRGGNHRFYLAWKGQ